MALERILVGDDCLDWARKAMPFVPNAEFTFVSTPEEVIDLAKTGNYTTIITDLQYTSEGKEGFAVLEALKELKVRKILWTGDTSQSTKDRAADLGAEYLAKDQIGALVGACVSSKPLKKGGEIMVYCKDNVYARSLKQVLDSVNFAADVRCDLRPALESDKYGLVVDTSTFGSKPPSQGTVAHDLKYVQLSSIPRVVCIYDPSTALVDILRAIAVFK